MVEYKTLEVEQLIPFNVRNIRPQVVDKIKERIALGYNPAKPLVVTKTKEGFIVADGNHRLQALKEIGIQSVPCIIYDDKDPYSLAVTSNQDEDTYAPMDLFDWLDVIEMLRKEGLTQAQIGEKIGWSRDNVKNYQRLIDSIGTNLIVLAKQHQKGRVPSEGTNVPTFNFTEGWFRNSGLYDLCEKYQLALIEAFIADKCKWNNEKVQKEAAKYKRWQEYIEHYKNSFEKKASLAIVD